MQVDNYRPYIEQLKQTRRRRLLPDHGQDPTPIVQAMKNIGYNPAWMLYSVQFYGPQASCRPPRRSAPSRRATSSSRHPVRDGPNKYPVLQQVKTSSTAPSPTRFTDFTAVVDERVGAVGEVGHRVRVDLTQDCVLQKAQAETAWTPAACTRRRTSTRPTRSVASAGWIKLTTDGFVYDEKVTNPTKGRRSTATRRT